MCRDIKRVGYSVILTTAIIFGLIPNVSASSKQKAANTACENALFSGKMLKADKENNSISIYAKEGKWKIRYAIDEDSTSADYSLVLGTKAKPNELIYTGGTTKSIPVGKGNAIFLVAEPEYKVEKNSKNEDVNRIVDTSGKVLKVSYTDNGVAKTTKCKAGTVSPEKSGKLKISDTAAYISQTFNASSLTKITMDEEEAKECKAMQEGKLKKDDETPYLSGAELQKYNAQMQSSFPYCYGDYDSSFEITADTIKKVRQSSLNAYKAYLDFQNKQQDNSKYETATKEIEVEGYKKLEYSKKRVEAGTLSCKKDQITATTEKYYTEHQEVKNDACQVDCVEQLQVTYDAPVATKAGMCFQYKVTVRSKVSCKTELKNKIKWPSGNANICDYYPICGGNDQEDQAGPNEKFDSCINSCDNGKYSQSCINKCYKEVYGKTKNKTNKTSSSNVKKTSNNTNSTSVIRLAKTNDEYHNIDKCKNNEQIKANVVDCAKKFYKLKQKEPMGSYKLAKKPPDWYDYKWEPDGNVDINFKSPSADDWIESIKRSSPYYFRSYKVALKTIQSFFGVNNGYNGYGEARAYVIDQNGIKRQMTSYKCAEECGFKISNTNKDCVSTSKQLEEYYTTAFDNIYDQLSDCTSKAECKSGVVSSFNIGVDYDKEDVTTGKENSGNNSWEATNKSGTSTSDMDNIGTDKNPAGSKKMFIPITVEDEQQKHRGNRDLETSNNNGINGICYGKDNASYWQHYKTTITFPGTWINLKSGKRIFGEPSSIEKDYLREKENYYCTGYDYKPVNETWWDWKVNNVGDIQNITVEKPDNIKAKIENFGKYNWSLNLNCFYGLSNEVTKCVGPTCKPSCSGGECSTTIKNIKMRAVDQQDLFAGRSNDKVGFNWTSAAQDQVALKADTKEAQSYGKNPGTYAKELQNEAKGNSSSVYSGTADYSLHLTKDNIKELRKYVKANGYTSYQGNGGNPYKEVKGIELYYYTSGILNKSEYTTNFKRNTILGVNNENDLGGVN